MQINTNNLNTSTENLRGVTPERILELLKGELRAQGMAESKINEYIIQNQEKLGIDAEIIELIDIRSSEAPKTVEKGGGAVSGRVEKAGKAEKTDNFQQIEGETQKVKQEIAQEREKSKAEIKEVEQKTEETPKDSERDSSASSEQEKERVEKAKPYTPGGISGVGKVDGYAPSLNVAQQSDKLVAKGNINESQTWQATLIERLEEMWGDIRNLFTAKQ